MKATHAIIALFTISLIASAAVLAIFPSLYLQADDPTAQAAGELPLLAVSLDAQDRVRTGGIAHLELKIIEGSGNVYVHADPFTKVDTQATTKFAQQYACRASGVDCSQYDFLYSIRSEAPIVGGPSAGAATTALTLSLLEGTPLPRNVAITGSINSGGIIGNVGGIPEKIEASRNAGIRTVVIPALSDYNETPSGMNIIRVDTLEEALEELNPRFAVDAPGEIDVPQAYRETMARVAAELCEFDPNIVEGFRGSDDRVVNETVGMITDLIGQAENASALGAYYTQASHCFNIQSRIHYLTLLDDLPAGPLGERIELLSQSLTDAGEEAHEDFAAFGRQNTISSIQIFSIVQERHDEAQRTITQIIDAADALRGEADAERIFQETLLFDAAYTLARIDSMRSWMEFGEYRHDERTVTRDALRTGCAQKLSELDERTEYLEYVIGRATIDTDEIRTLYRSREYEACIYRGSLLKARADMILSTIGTPESAYPRLIAAKTESARDAIAAQTAHGSFPVMAYSYFEYGKSLAEENPQVALLYLENAIELSGLDLYFPEPARLSALERRRLLSSLFWFSLGASLISLVGLMLLVSVHRSQQKPVRKRKAQLRKMKKR